MPISKKESEFRERGEILGDMPLKKIIGKDEQDANQEELNLYIRKGEQGYLFSSLYKSRKKQLTNINIIATNCQAGRFFTFFSVIRH